MAGALCRVTLAFCFLCAPAPIPEVVLGLCLQICQGLSRQWPARKVLSNVLWFRLARCHLQTGYPTALFSRTDFSHFSKRYLRPLDQQTKTSKQKPYLHTGKQLCRQINSRPKSRTATATWVSPFDWYGRGHRVKFAARGSRVPFCAMAYRAPCIPSPSRP